MKQVRVLLFVFTFLATALVQISNVQATSLLPDSPVNSLSLAVSPGIKEIITEPGKSRTISAQVTNITDKPLSISTSANRFEAFEKIPEKDRSLFDASAWIKLVEPHFILQPNETRTVDMQVTAPINAEPGGRYATVYFQPLVPTQMLRQNSAQIGARVGMLALFVTKGVMQEKLTVDSLKTSFLRESGPVEFELTVKNSGNIHVIPSGYIEILDGQGKRLSTAPLPISLILPKTTKTIEIPWDNQGRIGKFSARPVISYGTPSLNASGEIVSFWIAPWFGVSIWTLILGVIGFMIYRTRGRWHRAFRALGEHKNKVK
jgi:hypothetical protein